MIVLRENSQSGETVSLTHAQVAYLQTCDLVEVRPHGTAFRLVPRSRRIGAVHAHGLDVVVTPKVSIPRLLFMIGYAMNPGFLPENVEGVEADGLWAIVAETLCRNVERALSRGVLLGYTTEHAMSTVIRGRARIADQIARRPGLMMPMEITHDELTVDIAENRLLRTALGRMLAVPRVDTAIHARLHHLINRLAGVSPLKRGVSPPRWQPNRLNARYQPALRIAQLVLDTLSFEIGENGLSIAAFVVNMDKVFEDFVTAALTEAWKSGPGRTEPQFPVKLDTGGVISMNVDVVHLVDNVPRFVVDAKYKLKSRSGRYPNTDFYQVLAYCTALRVDHAWLVYAGDTAKATPHRISNSSVTITAYALDLDVPPQDLIGQVERLARSAWT